MICVLLKTLSPRVASNVLRTWAEGNNSQPKSVLETDFDCGQTLHTGPVGCVGGWSRGEQGLAIGSLWAGYGLKFSFNWKVWHENDSGESLTYWFVYGHLPSHAKANDCIQQQGTFKLRIQPTHKFEESVFSFPAIKLSILHCWQCFIKHC